MKKFSFSLQPLLKVKRIQEKQKKAELAEILNRLDELHARERDHVKQLEDSNVRYEKEMRRGMPLPRMAWYTNYADYLGTQLKTLRISIDEAQQKKEAKQAKLVSLMKEIKTIENLREEQYRAHLNEIAKEDEKVLGDLISYNKSTADSSLEIL